MHKNQYNKKYILNIIPELAKSIYMYLNIATIVYSYYPLKNNYDNLNN